MVGAKYVVIPQSPDFPGENEVPWGSRFTLVTRSLQQRALLLFIVFRSLLVDFYSAIVSFPGRVNVVLNSGAHDTSSVGNFRCPQVHRRFVTLRGMETPQTIAIRFITEFTTVAATMVSLREMHSSVTLPVPRVSANPSMFNLAMFHERGERQAGTPRRIASTNSKAMY